MTLSPLSRRRLRTFLAHRRGVWSLALFALLFGVSLFAELIANDKPLLVKYDGAFYAPIFRSYPETTFGGEFPTEADYKDPDVAGLIRAKGWMIWPAIPFSYDTIVKDLDRPAPSPPSARNLLGTDDQARDVLGRLIYSFRISVLFGFLLTVLGSAIGIAAGAVQGYFGGLTDLLFQRFLEIWSSMPVLYLLIIMASFIEPGFWSLLGIMLLFGWMGLVGLVRAEFLRGRNFDYVRAARALGMAVHGVVEIAARIGEVVADIQPLGGEQRDGDARGAVVRVVEHPHLPRPRSVRGIEPRRERVEREDQARLGRCQPLGQRGVIGAMEAG